ncbi:hypothetical protein E4U03_10985 [Rothia nasimurium]|uniref:Uncharacterized protein n=1 Tax=Rothia nasimurium TaxID=85336 RepID=A0A4Y9F237_9MICC|nr:hypothetical protein [Rothia nasimurium]MBF0809123.1 hypothetical protein [Rothia nasimurium]TFU20645.1 hypothetical protein E4U03_10985 [Rothia nasimurium]
MGTSYLHKALGAKQPLFQYWNSSTGTYSDDNIFSINITKGDDTPTGGTAVNTAEVEIHADVQNIIGARSRINLTSYGASLVASIAGNVTATQIGERFWGRTGIVKTNDVSNSFRTTVISSSGWLATLKKANYDPFISVGWKTGLAIINSLKFPNLAEMYTPVPYGVFDSIVKVPEKRRFSELAKLYADSMGLQIREDTSSHEVQVRSIQYRKDDVVRRSKTAPHLTRSAAISPAKHTQSLDEWYTQYVFATTMPDGSRGTIYMKGNNDKTFLDIQEVDWSYVRRDTEQLWQYANAIRNQSIKVFSRPESIRVDILYLLTSDSEHHRHQAGYLLALQAGDPVFFSFDWQEYARGVYFAQQIKETITHDTWELELSLYPAEAVVGEAMDRYNPKPQTWESAGELRWSDYSEKWNEV